MDNSTSISTPEPITAIAACINWIALGSVDGSIRLIQLPNTKVQKAVRKLGHEISSIVLVPSKSTDGPETMWVASGTSVLSFSTSTEKMIMDRMDAQVDVKLVDSDDDLINQIDVNKSHLAFSCDSGSIGVMDLSSKSISRMMTSHEQICYCVSFIPDKPRELVSGGYDCSILHHDYLLRNLLSSHNMKEAITNNPQSSDQFSLAPPFIQGLSISPSRSIAAVTADGRLLLGFGGTKGASSKKQKKWEGLQESGLVVEKVAEGPIIAGLWKDENLVILVTLGGTIKRYSVKDRKVEEIPRGDLKSQILKVNGAVLTGDAVVVAGLNKDAKGIAEVVSI